MEIIKSLAVILILVLLGISSRIAKIFSKEQIKVLSSFVYYFALPSLFFVSLSNTNLSTINYLIIAGSLLPIAFLLLLVYLLRLFKIINSEKFILLSLSVSLGSYSFFGVAFFETLYGGKWLSLAILTASVLGFTGISISLFYFEYAIKAEKGWKLLLKIVKNPLIIAILLGITFSVLNIKIQFLNRALSLLGKTAGGLAIFSLGIFIYDNFSWESVKNSLIYSGFRFLCLPVSSYFVLAYLLPLEGELKQFLFLQSGIPSAISLSVLAQRYNYKLAEVTGFVIITSVLSLIGLLILFFISNQGL